MNERSRTSKSKSNKNKASRRSPYPHIAVNPEYNAAAASDFTERPYEYGPEVPVHMQGYPGVMYSHAHEGMDARYSALYHSAYSHPSVYGDSSCVYPLPAHQRYLEDRNPYRGSYDTEKYYPTPGREHTPYPGYLSSQSPQETTSSTSRASTTTADRDSSYRHGDTTRGTGATSGGASYDCLHSGSSCSRSSSRDPPYPTQHTQTHSTYTAPFSNRSESSASEVDVVNEEYEKRHSAGIQLHGRTDRQNTGTKFDSLVEATKRLVKEEAFKNTTTSQDLVAKNPLQTSGTLAAATSKDSIPQSVIMRRQSTNYSNSDSTPNYHSPTRLKPPADSTQKQLSNSANNGTSQSPSAAYCASQTSAGTTAEKILDMRTSSQAVAYSSCVKNTCGYDTYNPTAAYHPASLQSQSRYPVMPQAGYTSVIVDAQQYHLANGYVH